MSCCFGVRRPKNLPTQQEDKKSNRSKQGHSKKGSRSGSHLDRQESRRNSRVDSKVQLKAQKVQSAKQEQPQINQEVVPGKGNIEKESQQINSTEIKNVGQPQKQESTQKERHLVKKNSKKSRKGSQDIKDMKQLKISVSNRKSSIGKGRSNDYANESSEVNATNLRQNPKAVKQTWNLFGKTTIVTTPSINTFRYDSILHHAYGRSKN